MWIALFSQSGSEIAAIANKLGRYPDVIYTNNGNADTYSKDLIIDRLLCMSHDAIVEDIERRIALYGSPMITLHGYLRIMPSLPVKMYNGHPGDIVIYPELKGKDPQKKALDMKLQSTGCVIHEVTEEVDSGKIVSYNTYTIQENETLDSLINNLRDISVDMWVDFLGEMLIAQ